MLTHVTARAYGVLVQLPNTNVHFPLIQRSHDYSVLDGQLEAFYDHVKQVLIVCVSALNEHIDLLRRVMLLAHEFAQVVNSALCFEHILSDGTGLVHVFSEACVPHEVDPALESITQVRIADLSYDADGVLRVEHFSLHDPSVAFEVFFGAFQVEIVEHAMKITESSLSALVLRVILANLIRANALERVSEDLLAHEALKVRETLAQVVGVVATVYQRLPYFDLHAELLILVKEGEIASNFDRCLGPQMPFLQSTSPSGTLLGLIGTFFEDTLLLMVPVLQEPSVPNLLQLALLHEPFNVASVLGLDGASLGRYLVFNLHLFKSDGVRDLHDLLVHVGLPFSERRAQVVLLEVVHELLSDPGDFGLLLDVAIAI